MEALKIILTVVLCAVVSLIISVSVSSKSESCEHTCPEPIATLELVTLADFNEYEQAVRKVRAAQRENNEASLVAIQLAQAGVIENRRATAANTDFIQTMTEQNIKFVTATKDGLELLVTRTQSNHEAIKMITENLTKFIETTLKIVEGGK
jgi:hypothetical protein